MFSYRRLVKEASLPPREGPPLIKILSAPPDGKMVVVCLDGPVKGYLVHYVERRTRPHIEPKHLCPYCPVQPGVRWKGYLPVWVPLLKQFRILELTDGAYRYCQDLHNATAQDLRGRGLEVFRLRPGRQSPAACKLTERYQGRIPASFDLHEALLRIWGCGKDDMPADDQGDDQTDPLSGGDHDAT